MAQGRSKKTITDQLQSSNNYLEGVSHNLESKQSKLSMVLGGLIVLVVGILVFNYFNRQQPEIGPSQQTEQQEDVSPEGLPGKYTVKEGETLFEIADKYYQDGYKYPEIAKANSLPNPDLLETGQVLEIPKLETEVAEVSPSISPQTQETTSNIVPAGEKGAEVAGTGGGNNTIWGAKIEGDTYTVIEGDWLSKIAGRAYGDIYAYNKIAEANKIPNPDLIEPGTVLKIPR